MSQPYVPAEEDANVNSTAAATLRSYTVPSIASSKSTSGIDRPTTASMEMCTGEETPWPKIDEELNPSVVRVCTLVTRCLNTNHFVM